MKTLRGPAAYADIIPLLNEAGVQGGLRIPCDNYGAAIKLRQRMNQFRILDRQLNERAKCARPLPLDKTEAYYEDENRTRRKYLVSSYDNLIIKQIDSYVIIEIRPKTTWGTVTDLAGNPVEIGPPDVTWDPIADKVKSSLDKDAERYRARNPQPEAPIENKSEDIIKGLYEE
jgi:hypothetical protein